MSPERTTRKAWYPRVRCVILIPPVTVYKQIEVAMHNLNACLRGIRESSTEITCEDCVVPREHDVVCGCIYIVVWRGIRCEGCPACCRKEAKKQGKPLSSKQKKDMWDARVKEVCASWSSQVFKYATIVNPSLGPDFLAAVRELHNSLARVEKSKREVAHSVGLDRVKAFASAGIHNSLKIELLKVHYSDEKTREKYHHPTKFVVDNDLRPWLVQWALWSSLELLSCDIVRKIGIVCGPKEEDDDERTAHREGTCLLPSLEKRIPQKEEDPFNVSHDRFESGEEDEVFTQAEFVEPSKNIDGLVLDTSRTKKQKEARQSSKAEEEEETGGSTPTGKAKEQPKPRSGRTRSAKKQTKDKARKQLKKKRDELAEAEPVLETPALEIEPNVTEAGTSTPVVEEQAPGNDKSTQKEEARQRKRTKKQPDIVLYEGVFREDIYFPMKNRCVIVKSSLKETHELLHGNKTKAIKDPVPIVEELKKMCAALESKRAGGYLMTKKPVQTAADCLYLDLPSGLKLDEDDTEVPDWNIFPDDDDLPRKLMGLGRSVFDDRGCLIILHQGSLRSAQQIADALDAYSQVWKQVTSFDVQSDLPQFDEVRNYKHSKIEVFCKASHNFIIPKLDMPPFDADNTGRDSSFICNYNHLSSSKLDDGGRRKCTGFVQTLLENFTAQGDIVIDFAGGWGATLQAANNCG
ncbi:hypothetical protein R1sor_020047 [Riccia sorocarpa]|uniref:Uncharacterized protein n=1 Tax=Riccia sorocarpa TaxID=122646 RepID=A0ABD3IHX5_9MARC